MAKNLFDLEEARDRLTKEYDKQNDKKKSGWRLPKYSKIYSGLGIAMYIVSAALFLVKQDTVSGLAMLGVGLLFTLAGRHLDKKGE